MKYMTYCIVLFILRYYTNNWIPYNMETKHIEVIVSSNEQQYDALYSTVEKSTFNLSITSYRKHFKSNTPKDDEIRRSELLTQRYVWIRDKDLDRKTHPILQMETYIKYVECVNKMSKIFDPETIKHIMEITRARKANGRCIFDITSRIISTLDPRIWKFYADALPVEERDCFLYGLIFIFLGFTDPFSEIGKRIESDTSLSVLGLKLDDELQSMLSRGLLQLCECDIKHMMQKIWNQYDDVYMKSNAVYNEMIAKEPDNDALFDTMEKFCYKMMELENSINRICPDFVHALFYYAIAT